MSDRMHRTERGALLDALEHKCLRPGEWAVEGHNVVRTGRDQWRVTRMSTGAPVAEDVSFVAALEAVAEAIEERTG